MKKLVLVSVVMFLNIQIKAQCWQSIAPCYGHTLAIKSDGTLWAWGYNSLGTLGDGSTISENSPIQIGIATDWQKIAGGYNHSVAIKNDGTLWAWGWNYYGQLGDGTNIDKLVPTQIGIESNWSSVDAGSFSTIAIKTDGTMWAWGYNQIDGILGIGNNIDKNIPTQIGSDTDWQTISIGNSHAVAIKSNGTLWAWGNNAQGALGDGTTVLYRNIPTNIGVGSNWQSIAVGFLFTLAIKSDGTLWSWGVNSSGQLGDGTTINKNIPIQIGTNNNWQAVSAGSGQSVALKVDKSLYTWGLNDNGQLGDGTIVDKNTPTQIGSLTNWQNIAAGWYHTLALKTDLTLLSCGYNSDGQLGIGTNINNSNFTQITCAPLGTVEVALNNNPYTIFPNPTKDLLHFQKATNDTIDKIIISDFSGKKVMEQNNNPESINVQILQQGIYLLEVFIAGRDYKDKFIKE